MDKVLSDHFSCIIAIFGVFDGGTLKFGHMVWLQLSAATWLINTKTLPRTAAILNISFRNITNGWNTFISLLVQKCRLSVFLTGATLSLGIWCDFSWARPLGWLIPKRWWRPQLFPTYVWGSSLMDKILSDNFSCKNVDFRRFWRGYPKIRYMVSLQLSAATWLINTKTLLRTTPITNISFRNITIV